MLFILALFAKEHLFCPIKKKFIATAASPKDGLVDEALVSPNEVVQAAHPLGQLRLKFSPGEVEQLVAQVALHYVHKVLQLVPAMEAGGGGGGGQSRAAGITAHFSILQVSVTERELHIGSCLTTIVADCNFAIYRPFWHSRVMTTTILKAQFPQCGADSAEAHASQYRGKLVDVWVKLKRQKDQRVSLRMELGPLSLPRHSQCFHTHAFYSSL